MFRVVSFIGILSMVTITMAAAQTPEPTTHTSVPRVIRIAGTLPKPVSAPSPIETITFAIYADETGETPLWQETQTVIVDPTGAYTALLGSTVPDGLPLEIFTRNDARWLSIHLEGATEPDQPRVLIASVAYALRAADADTLGGRPASAYVLADPITSAPPTSVRTTSTTKAGTNPPFSTSTVGTPGHLGLFTDSFNLGDSVVVQSGARIGMGAPSPADYLHVAFNDPFGAFTGLAVQNLSGSANAASGMLFYDQNGALGQFQGFNNTSHSYVINNIAKNGSNQFDGSIGFLIGSSPSLWVAPNGNVGIGGATNPLRDLQIGPSSDTTFTISQSDGSPRAGFIRFGDHTGWSLLIGRSRECSGCPLNSGFTGNLFTIGDDGAVYQSGGYPLGATGVEPLCRTLANAITRCQSSSLRYKTDLTPYRSGLTVINRLSPVTFTRKQSGMRDIGLIAEEVEKAEPLFTFYNEKGEVESVKYELLAVVFINAIKEQQAQIEHQQDQLQSQQRQIDALKRLNKAAAARRRIGRTTPVRGAATQKRLAHSRLKP